MKTLIKLALGLVAIVGVAVLATQFLPSHWQVKRSIVIHVSPIYIFPRLVLYRGGWEHWCTLDAEDLATVYTFSGPYASVGAARAWTSASMGHVYQKFLAADTVKGVDLELNLEDRHLPMLGHFRFEPRGHDTLLTWTMEGDLGRDPRLRLQGLLMESTLGGMMESSLGNLKAILDREALARALKAKKAGAKGKP